ncbi:MAG: putative adenylyltransferase [Methanoregulaceae archaeon PtaB.Bin152]|nr:MAG: putative adenylyltransferase [Methanoregulaceae archaeon PtaB.Bin152]
MRTARRTPPFRKTVVPDRVLSGQERERYQRQMMLFGEKGQIALKNSSVLVAGAGGLGSPVAYYLACAGIGHIRIVDHDKIERSNLNRQILHGEDDIGTMKVESAREKLARLNPDIMVDLRSTTIDERSIVSLLEGVDIIVDAMDNYPARYILNRAAISHGIPLVHGAVHGFSGQATTVVPGKSACLRCLFPNPPPEEIFPVVGAAPGLIGLLQVHEVLKYLLGMGSLLINRLILWDGLSCTIEELPFEKNPSCADCSTMNLQEFTV